MAAPWLRRRAAAGRAARFTAAVGLPWAAADVQVQSALLLAATAAQLLAEGTLPESLRDEENERELESGAGRGAPW